MELRSRLTGKPSKYPREKIREYDTGHQHFMHQTTNAEGLNEQNIPRNKLAQFVESLTTDILHRRSNSPRSGHKRSIEGYRLDCQQPAGTK